MNLVLLGLLGFLAYKAATSTAPARTSTGTPAGLVVPPGVTLSSADVASLRGILDGTGSGLSTDALRVAVAAGLHTWTAAERLTVANRTLADIAAQMAYGPQQSVNQTIVSLG